MDSPPLPSINFFFFSFLSIPFLANYLFHYYIFISSFHDLFIELLPAALTILTVI